ncbi:hypothetical protein PQQ75_05420 [Paraburkholderia aspalathi]|uniref:hypothetical protein n=1 Tax=Paraburkholderia aspalathi TaxID=1324617 RepID=UPI0038B8D482
MQYIVTENELIEGTPKHQKPTQRLYVTEGSVHLYSSMPSVLTPADLYQAKVDAALRQVLIDCNVYVIAARKRILIDSNSFSLSGNVMHGQLIVQRPDGIDRVPFRWSIPDELTTEFGDVEDVAVALSGTHVNVSTARRSTLFAAHAIVMQAESGLTDQDRDLEVLYVGQGIGRSKQRSAIDRLLDHSTLQRILAESVTFSPESEILLLLYRFEHRKTIMSTGGDFNAEPVSNSDEERAHLARMGNVALSRHAQVALAEAALIRYFQPVYNTMLKESDFAARKKIRILERLLTQDMTGLIVEICSGNIRSRLRSASAAPLDLTQLLDPEALNGSRLECDDDRLDWADQLHTMAHSHFANFPLTTPDERDTFMHGMAWSGLHRQGATVSWETEVSGSHTCTSS